MVSARYLKAAPPRVSTRSGQRSRGTRARHARSSGWKPRAAAAPPGVQRPGRPGPGDSVEQTDQGVPARGDTQGAGENGRPRPAPWGSRGAPSAARPPVGSTEGARTREEPHGVRHSALIVSRPGQSAFEFTYVSSSCRLCVCARCSACPRGVGGLRGPGYRSGLPDGTTSSGPVGGVGGAMQKVTRSTFSSFPAPVRRALLHAPRRYAPWEEGFDFSPPALPPRGATPGRLTSSASEPRGLERRGGSASSPLTPRWPSCQDIHKERHFFDRFARRPLRPRGHRAVSRVVSTAGLGRKDGRVDAGLPAPGLGPLRCWPKQHPSDAWLVLLALLGRAVPLRSGPPPG